MLRKGSGISPSRGGSSPNNANALKFGQVSILSKTRFVVLEDENESDSIIEQNMDNLIVKEMEKEVEKSREKGEDVDDGEKEISVLRLIDSSTEVGVELGLEDLDKYEVDH